ncbi:hypothetical protein ACFQT0_05970 [Hymenobacter humi]|uniref:Peptidase S9A N-terminal domain-containing protein n=1 Tax=Hymenobacter humi TaxID=1411620 RepID=A0ABW2U0J9_9BACT
MFSKNDGLQNQPVLYRQRGIGEPQVLLDANKLSADGTTALAATEFSNDHRYLAYAISSGGSDWNKVRILDLKTNQPAARRAGMGEGVGHLVGEKWLLLQPLRRAQSRRK